MIYAVRSDSQRMLEILETKVGLLPGDQLNSDVRDIGLECFPG